MSKQNTLKEAIQSYLDERAKTDELFAVTYKKKNKNIDECFAYIMGEALKESSPVVPGVEGCGMDNDVVYGMAVHYYDEDNIKINKLPANVKASASVTSNNASASKLVKLTEEDEKRAREEAVKRLTEEQYALLRKKPSRSKKEVTEVQQMSLF
ncbi:PcfK-like family protein [Bacteroides stercorirosoris]|uniref:PcfK-like family protein n=1 Tax=Bacteroides stercorirosoris TaxID=871324 RepID=UPI0023F71F85|nr:PcfK-like family protein [Bacteroides stercorirosoris]